MAEKSEKNDKDNSSASNVFRLSPRDLFEVLLGEPDDRGYDEEMLKEANEQAPNRLRPEIFVAVYQRRR